MGGGRETAKFIFVKNGGVEGGVATDDSFTNLVPT